MITPSRRKAFTIVELLVVIAIIALLVSILLPAIGKARDQAKLTQSLSNLKNLGVAHASYAAEWNGRQFTLIDDNIGKYGQTADVGFQGYFERNGQLHPPINFGTATNADGTSGEYIWPHAPGALPIHSCAQPLVMEPSNGIVEGGCQGTIRVEVRVPGERAHSARSWQGSNAVHSASEILDRLNGYVPREPTVDGLRYREGLNAVGIRGGVAGNVIPDECIVTVNYRFAPDLSVAAAIDHLREVFDGFELTVVDEAPGARPGLDRTIVASFVDAMGGTVEPKYGWTDVARFSALGTPAVNFGPGDPTIAHSVDEHVDVSEIHQVYAKVSAWLDTAENF